MRIFYDTEFIEDGRTIDLISIGMVAEDGRELYLVNQKITRPVLYDRIRMHVWLMANVVPHLPLVVRRRDGLPSVDQPGSPNVFPRRPGRFDLDMGDNRIVSMRYIRNAVRAFITDTPDAELWAYYGAYDHVVLAQLWGAMVDLPAGVPMWTNDVRQEMARLGDPPMPEQAGAEHNALDDARHVKAMFEHLNAEATP